MLVSLLTAELKSLVHDQRYTFKVRVTLGRGAEKRERPLSSLASDGGLASPNFSFSPLLVFRLFSLPEYSNEKAKIEGGKQEE